MSETDVIDYAIFEIKSQFFQRFYIERIEYISGLELKDHRQLDLAILNFWCSVIDFYGGIYWIGKNNDIQKRGRDRHFTLATEDSFKLFINDYFKKPENEYGNFIYKIFRSGTVHQLSPKKSAIHWVHPIIQKLVWIDIDQDNTDPYANKVAHLNLKKFGLLAYSAFKRFYFEIESKLIPTACVNIFNHLLGRNDLLNDGESLDKAYFDLLSRGLDIAM